MVEERDVLLDSLASDARPGHVYEPTRRGREGECSGAAWYDPAVNPRGKGARAILTFSITVDIDGSGPTQHGPTASCGDPARVPECSQGVAAAVSQRG